MKSKVKAAALCRLSNGRLPNCNLKENLQESPSELKLSNKRNHYGFYGKQQCLYIKTIITSN